MERYLYDRRAGDYRERVGARPARTPGRSRRRSRRTSRSRACPGLQAQAPVRARFATLERRFRSAAAYAAWPHGELYLDDNEWLAQDFLDWSDLAAAIAARARAAAIFNAVVDAWDDVATHPCAGGVFWTTSPANRDRNTVSTANGALVGLRLYAATRQSRYLRVVAGACSRWVGRAACSAPTGSTGITSTRRHGRPHAVELQPGQRASAPTFCSTR